MRQMCELLDCSDDTVRRLVARGLLAPARDFRGLGKRWTEDDLTDYLYRTGPGVDEDTPPPDPPKPK